MIKTDILIIGSGIAGLFFALKTAQKRPDLSIVIMTKGSAERTNTQMAQGGIAVVTDLVNDSFEKHIEDTLQSGGGHCDENIVNMVIRQAPQRLKELIALGTSFDKDQEGNWDLGLEGGHSQNRILHHKDSSGLEIEKSLLRSLENMPNIHLLEHHLVIDLNTEKRDETVCSGAFYYDQSNNQIKYINSRTIVLCTGGSGQLFENTTNPEIATGDGVAMAERLGLEIEDMQYIQFHPTALFAGKKNPYFLISEAVRGFGAHVVNKDEKRFLFKYDSRGELATRDIVSQGISMEMQQSQTDHVYLDCRHLDKTAFYKHFPVITAHCNELGLYPEKDLIPIVPAAHYQCGGIKVDENGATKIKNLYAIGECSRTGLHGKNRLASNSLLEAIVFAHQASENISNTIKEFPFSIKVFVPQLPFAKIKTECEKTDALKKELQSIMTAYYTNEDSDIIHITAQIEKIKNKTIAMINRSEIILPVIELSNMITTAQIVIKQCTLERTKTTDFFI